MAKIRPQKNATKKDTILQKATTLFRQKGYNATSMRHLAEAVGVEAASLYNHIESKGHLLQAICMSVADAFTAHLDKVEQSRSSNAEKVEQIIRFQVQMMLKRYEEVYVSNRDWKHLKDPDMTGFLQQRRQYEKRFAAIIQKGIDEKEFKNIHPYIAVLTILSAVRGIEFWQRNKRQVSETDLENDLVQLLISGMSK